MAKIKVTPSKEHPITLKLTQAELEVIALLISNTIIGHSNVYGQAATSLCQEIFHNEDLYNLIGDLDEPTAVLDWVLEKDQTGAFLSLIVSDSLNRV